MERNRLERKEGRVSEEWWFVDRGKALKGRRMVQDKEDVKSIFDLTRLASLLIAILYLHVESLVRKRTSSYSRELRNVDLKN